MARFLSGLATALFGLRCFVNVMLLVAIVKLFIDVRASDHPLAGLLVFAIFGAMMFACLLLPILIATVVCAVQFVRGSRRWRSLAMRVVAAGLVCDLFFLSGGSRSWWIGAAIVTFDLSLWALLAYVDARCSDADADRAMTLEPAAG